MKPYFSLLLILPLALLAGCAEDKNQSVPTTTVSPSAFELSIDELGVVASTRVANIKAPHRGRIIQFMEEGQLAKLGEVVATLDVRELEEDLQERIDDLKQVKKDLESTLEGLMIAQRSNTLDISSAEAQLDMARVELESVNKELSELEYLFDNELVPQDQVREASVSLRSTQTNTLSQDMDFRSQLTEAQSTKKSTMIRIERIGMDSQEKLNRISDIKEQIRNAQIKAPVEGIFIKEKRWNWRQRMNQEWKVGEEVREGTLLGTIPDLNSLVVQSQIPERHLMDVDKGTKVQLTFEALNNLQLDGVIDYIAPVAIERETSPGGQLMATGETLTGEKVFEVTIALEAKGAVIQPGNAARVRIILDRREGLLTVPLAAVTTEEDKHFVMVEKVVGEKSTFERREVRLGQSNNSSVEVLEGLTAGEKLQI